MHFQIVQSKEKLFQRRSINTLVSFTKQTLKIKIWLRMNWKYYLPFCNIDIDKHLSHHVQWMRALQYFLFPKQLVHIFCSGIFELSKNNGGHERRCNVNDSIKDEQTSGCNHRILIHWKYNASNLKNFRIVKFKFLTEYLK